MFLCLALVFIPCRVVYAHVHVVVIRLCNSLEMNTLTLHLPPHPFHDSIHEAQCNSKCLLHLQCFLHLQHLANILIQSNLQKCFVVKHMRMQVQFRSKNTIKLKPRVGGVSTLSNYTLLA